MTVEEIKELIEVVNQTGIAELEVQRGDNRVRIRRCNGPTSQEYVLSQSAQAVVTTVAPQPPTGVHPAENVTAPSVPAASGSAQDKTVYVKSPIVGTFYEAASPDSAPFIKVGDHIQPGQVLCIIESMKLMNEIEAEVSGVVMGRLVENGRPVEYGEALFAVQPL